MNTTTSRETFSKSPTTDLAGKIDEILDRRFVHSTVEDTEPTLKQPKPIATLRSLIKGLAASK